MAESVLAEIHDRWFDQIATAAAAHVTKSVPGSASLRILDLGCGSGTLLAALDERFVSRYGLDPSPEMIRRASHRVPGGRFTVGDLFAAELPQVEVVTMVGEILSYATAMEVPDLASVLRGFFERVHRCLAPSGLFLFDVLGDQHRYDGRFIHDAPEWSVFSEVTQSGAFINRHIVSFLRRGTAFEKSVEDHPLRLFDADLLEAQLRQAGFEARRIGSYAALPIYPGRVAFECLRAW